MATIAVARGLRSIKTFISSSNTLNRLSKPAVSLNFLDVHHNQRRWKTDYPSHDVVGLPSLSPTMEAGAIASWTVEEGDSFGAGDVLCEIETDKATVAFEAQDEGFVAKILEESGPDEIQCGDPILVTVEDEDDIAAFKDYVVETTKVEAPATTEPPVVDTPIPVPATSIQEISSSVPPAVASTQSTSGRTIASPLAWKLGNEKNIDLASIAIVGTGPDGRIIAQDVREYTPSVAAISSVTAAAAIPPPPPILGDGYTDYLLSPAAQKIADDLTSSKLTVPHYYLTVDVSLDALLKLRSTLNSSLNLLEGEAGISLNDILIKAVAASMKTCPAANSSWMGSAVRVYESVDINVVVGNGDSLYAPVIRNVCGKGIKGISDEIASHMEKIEDETMVEDPAFSSVGTVTVMNLGMYGIKSCAPIIRQPQAVALAFGAAENRIVPNDDKESEEIYKESIMLTVTLSCDHRVVDGAVGAQWLAAFKAAVENPSTLLL